MPNPTFKLKIADGKITAIYSDLHADLMAKGTATVRRASAVEPTEDGTGWTATMNDGTVLGPFRLRQTALDEEVRYLDAKLFKEATPDEHSRNGARANGKLSPTRTR